MLALVREHAGQDLSNYSDAVHQAFGSTNAIFTSPVYAEFFWHCASTIPGWVAQVVLANAAKESEGSATLWRLWQCVRNNKPVEDGVMRHAKDESRHSRLFLELARISFPATIEIGEIERLHAALPDVRKLDATKASSEVTDDGLIDSLVWMNLGEIRTRIHVQFLAPVIHALAPEDNRKRVRQIFQGLVSDETRHIAYTAALMEAWARSGNAARLGAFYRRRLRDFNLFTIEETGDAVRAYGHGCFPKLLEI